MRASPFKRRILKISASDGVLLLSLIIDAAFGCYLGAHSSLGLTNDGVATMYLMEDPQSADDGVNILGNTHFLVNMHLVPSYTINWVWQSMDGIGYLSLISPPARVSLSYIKYGTSDFVYIARINTEAGEADWTISYEEGGTNSHNLAHKIIDGNDVVAGVDFSYLDNPSPSQCMLRIVLFNAGEALSLSELPVVRNYAYPSQLVIVGTYIKTINTIVLAAIEYEVG